MELLEFLAWMILLAAFLTLHHKLSNKNNHPQAPASPASLPVIGHLHLLGKLPHHSLFRLSQAYGPDFMFLKLGSVRTMVISSGRGAKEVFKTHDLVFASRPRTTVSKELSYDASNLAFAPYGEYWRFVRKLSTLELFTSKQVDKLHPLREIEVSSMLSVLEQASERHDTVDLSALLRGLTFNMTCRMVLGKITFPGEDACNEEARSVHDALLQSLSLAGKVYIGEVLPFLRWVDFPDLRRMRAIREVIDKFLQKELDEHRTRFFRDGRSSAAAAAETSDFLHQMLSLGSMSDTRMKALALDVLLAGTDTTAATLEWAMSELMKNPSSMSRAQQELQKITGRKRAVVESTDIPHLKYLNAIIRETLRLHPPAPLLLPHESTDSSQVDEYLIPAKTRLIINAYAIGRDPSQWENPEEFDPERFMESPVDVRGLHYQLIPFGTGRRMCPACSLASPLCLSLWLLC